ncbi:hypothetical protein G3M48_001747 [Beauveria asiatica]|uniref:GPI inositol-deacylase n=1 Tax=Beauveria asiatica TaxID=1069075 RepID=A0AAW0RFR5_9HYPO
MAAQTESSTRAAAPAQRPRHPPPPDATSDDEAANVAAADAVEHSTYPDQDDVQAVLQPAMSRAASHLTSIHTPAVEKVAAMERMTGFFETPAVVAEDSNDDDDDDAATATATTTKRPSTPQKAAVAANHKSSPPSMPTPFNSQDVYQQSTTTTTRTQHTKSLLGSSLGPTRHQRSGSAGQDALKRFQKVLPSFGSPSSFLPTKYLNNLADSMPSISIGGHHATRSSRSQTTTTGGDAPRLQAQTKTMPVMAPPADSSRLQQQQQQQQQQRPGSLSLRRTASDESILYHTLSRQSSLGDDDRFHDVREMVNMRLLAFRDSLPDVPNFKMPSLAKLQATARRSTHLSLNGIFSTSDNASVHAPPSSSSRDAAPAPPTSNQASPAPAPASPPPLLRVKDDFDDMLQHLTGDVVILGGYRGSVLRSADPPHHQLWAPVKLGLNLRKADLQVGLTDADEESMPQRIVPSGMLKNIGPIDVSRKLFRKLQASPHAQAGRLRVWDFGYDWRLSPRRLSKQLQEFLASLPANSSNQPGGVARAEAEAEEGGPGRGRERGGGHEPRGAIVIAHSLGGLITRHAVNQRPELFAGVLYAGTPHQCMNILGPLRNGDAVLFNEKLLTARVNFSIRTSFALLPEDGFCFVDKETGEPLPVDFLDPMSWVRYRLSPCLEPPLPALAKASSSSSSSSSPLSPAAAAISSSSLSSFLPHSFLRPRSDSKGDRLQNELDPMTPSMTTTTAATTTTATTTTSPPTMTTTTTTTKTPAAPSSSSTSSTIMTEAAWLAGADSDRRANYEYLRRTLGDIRAFRLEARHDARLEAANAYPPLAVLYGKAIPTVCAAAVHGRDGIARADAYDDLVFRSGDGVVLAREAMLPAGYALVRGGRVSTERGHITLLGDMPALGRALKALVRGRRKGIGLGNAREKS